MQNNTSGIIPKFFRVLVLVDNVEDKTSGGLIKPDTVLEKEKMAQARGPVIAVGSDAFSDTDDAVRVGDIAIFPRYEGTEVDGVDGRKYRLIEDKYLIGIEQGDV